MIIENEEEEEECYYGEPINNHVSAAKVLSPVDNLAKNTKKTSQSQGQIKEEKTINLGSKPNKIEKNSEPVATNISQKSSSSISQAIPIASPIPVEILKPSQISSVNPISKDSQEKVMVKKTKLVQKEVTYIEGKDLCNKSVKFFK